MIFEAIDQCRESGYLGSAHVVALSWWSVVSDALLDELFPEGFPGWHAEHASRCETSLMLHLRPETVKPERPDHTQPPPAGIFFHPCDANAVSTQGVLSRTTGSSAEIGKRLFSQICGRIEELLRQSQNTLEA
jgi:creatinine amidohydrolase